MLTEKPRFPIRDIVFLGFWPTFLKKWIYRLKGYKIGRGVSFGFGSIISGKEVSIGDYTKIGFFTVIRGETIRLGRYVNIGATCIIDTPHLDIGEGSKINEQVFVGGLQFPDSKLVIGKNCQIMQMSFVNPTRGITIGDDSGIGGDCLLFGHYSWLSQFEGYPADFRPIEIGKSVSVAWRVFVGAGAKIGDGAVIGANSLVNRNIPPRCLATGSPAKVVSKAPYFPCNVTEEQKVKYLRDILTELVGFLKGHRIDCKTDDSLKLIEVVHRKNKWWGSSQELFRMQVESEPVREDLKVGPSGPIHVLLSLRSVPDDIRRDLVRRQIMWIDIENKERSDHGNDLGEEVVMYLRRYGVRFNRC